jgi:hypothetical protein
MGVDRKIKFTKSYSIKHLKEILGFVILKKKALLRS